MAIDCRCLHQRSNVFIGLLRIKTGFAVLHLETISFFILQLYFHFIFYSLLSFQAAIVIFLFLLNFRYQKSNTISTTTIHTNIGHLVRACFTYCVADCKYFIIYNFCLIHSISSMTKVNTWKKFTMRERSKRQGVKNHKHPK